MTITINGDGTIGGVSVGGLPDGIVDTDMLASAAVTSAKVGSLADSNLPAGSVLQVVYGWTNTSSSTSSNSMQDTGLTATITPSSTSNKILILISQQGYVQSDNGLQLQLMRGATTIWYNANATHTQYAGANWQSHPHIHYDSPSTTSAVTYKTQYCSRDNGETVGVQGNNYLSTITLMEIAA